MSIFYLDYVNGDDANDGSSWAHAWKTITLGATAERIAPGDIIRIAKSPAPTSIGDGTWTNLSKTVTLAAAQNLTIDLCESVWTAVNGAAVILESGGLYGKQGNSCMRITAPSSPVTSTLYGYFATGALNLSSYQKISFWLLNSGVLATGNWKICLCSDVAGTTVVDTFLIPVIPSYNYWLPLTLTRVGGGNLGAAIQSIALYSDTVAPTGSKFLRLDDFIACTAVGLNLQSLISKNSLEQGGSEGWYGIQSIDGVTVLLDNDPSCKANAGQGYSTIGTSPDTVTTYKRETIKTALVSSSTSNVQQILEGGTPGSNIEFQGGWNISTTIQEGETFFDGLNGRGKGIYGVSLSHITLNYLCFCRYASGINFSEVNNSEITHLSNANNNYNNGLFWGYSGNNKINIGNANNEQTAISFYELFNSEIIIGNVNNNTYNALQLERSDGNIMEITNINNNGYYGLYFYYGNLNLVIAATNIKDNMYGIEFYCSFNNIVKSFSTSGSTVSAIFNDVGVNFLDYGLINEAAVISNQIAYANSKIFSSKHNQTAYSRIFTDGGQIDSLDTDRTGGTGIMWKLAITSANRASYYPLDLKIATIAVLANKLVTVKVYMKKDHATNVGGKLVCKGGQISGVPDDVVDTKANDTNWEELEITFTPTEVGVIEIEAWAYYLAANGDVYVEDMSITQAD